MVATVGTLPDGTHWYLAPSLIHLLAEIDAAHPNRNRNADGSIGDAAHAAQGRPWPPLWTGSDHEPDINGVVCGLDITHDPAHGVDEWHLANHLKADPRVHYVIAQSPDRPGQDQIYNIAVAPYWRDQAGNEHYQHVHISLWHTAAAENRVYSWFDPQPAPTPTDPPEEDEVRPTLERQTGESMVWLVDGDRQSRRLVHSGDDLTACKLAAGMGDAAQVTRAWLESIPIAGRPLDPRPPYIP